METLRIVYVVFVTGCCGTIVARSFKLVDVAGRTPKLLLAGGLFCNAVGQVSGVREPLFATLTGIGLALLAGSLISTHRTERSLRKKAP